MLRQVMRMQRRFLFRGLAIGILLLPSCYVSAKNVKVNNCPAISPGVAPNLMPANSKARRVIIMPVSIGEITQAQDAAVNATLEQAITEIIGKAGADVVDRSLAGKLEDEIKRYEQRGESNYKSDLATDAVEIHIANVSFASEYVLPSTYELDGKEVTNPPKCSYSSRISGFVKVLSVNPISERKTISFDSKRTESMETTTDTCEVSDEQKQGYIRAVAKKAIQNEDTKAEIFEQFRPVGYVMQARKCKGKKENYIWINLLPEDGAEPGNSVQIYRQETFMDPISKKQMMNPILVAEGKIIKTANVNQAWVQVKNKDDFESILIGDVVEVFAKKSLFKSFMEKTGIGD